MQYKTMVLYLLEQHPAMQEQLRSQRRLLLTLELLATALKSRHEFWKDQLSLAMPNRHESQRAGEALELALREMEESLPSESPPSDPL